MATKKFLELQDYTDADLQVELEKVREQYQRMKFEHATQGLENPLALRETRRDIARLATEIRRRELAKMDEKQLARRSKIRARRRKQK
ncbi:MAG TPA: 50S ribosomal protein L29 [Phaeodactylibacter sp.]|nr:50S ribosomal protein L29 [Phaeodactylibacter sp.]